MAREVTPVKILGDIQYSKKVNKYAFISWLGVFSTVACFALKGELGSLAMVLLFFILIPVFLFGVIPLRRWHQKKSAIVNDRIKLVRDVVTRKERVGNRYLLMYKEYSARTEVGIRVSEKLYQESMVGDEFFMVYVCGDSRPLAVYSVKEYYFPNVSEAAGGSGQEITTELMLKDAGVMRAYIAHGFSLLLGIGIPMIPVLQIGQINTNTIISVVFLFLIFGSLFGILFGLKPLIITMKTASCIKNGNIKVVVDRVVSKQYREHYDRRSCLLTFEEYSKVSGKGIFRSEKTYEAVKKGDEFYLVYVGKDKEPQLLYPVKEYYYR